MEQIYNVNNYNWPLQNNSFSNTYNPDWKNHPNLGWRDQSNSQKPINPPDFSTRPLEPINNLGWRDQSNSQKLINPPDFSTRPLEPCISTLDVNFAKRVRETNDRFDDVNISMNNMMPGIRDI